MCSNTTHHAPFRQTRSSQGRFSPACAHDLRKSGQPGDEDLGVGHASRGDLGRLPRGHGRSRRGDVHPRGPCPWMASRATRPVGARAPEARGPGTRRGSRPGLNDRQATPARHRRTVVGGAPSWTAQARLGECLTEGAVGVRGRFPGHARSRIFLSAASARSPASGRVPRYCWVVVICLCPSRSLTTCRSAPPASSQEA